MLTKEMVLRNSIKQKANLHMKNMLKIEIEISSKNLPTYLKDLPKN